MALDRVDVDVAAFLEEVVETVRPFVANVASEPGKGSSFTIRLPARA